MAKNEISGSQQQQQGKTIGTQGHNDLGIPGPATHGSHQKPQGKDDIHIPNQQHSSASNERNAEQEERNRI